MDATLFFYIGASLLIGLVCGAGLILTLGLRAERKAYRNPLQVKNNG
jgi:hypothetical protein